VIKVMVASLPTLAQLQTRFEAIDFAHVYTNHGPMVRRLEEQVSQNLGIGVNAVANCTLGLEALFGALRRLFGVDRVLVPAMTFRATGLAAIRAGLTVHLADIGIENWQLPVSAAEEWLAQQPPGKAAIAPVATFGAPVAVHQWAGFAERFNAHVVVDAAGALYTQGVAASRFVHYAWSLHATKFIGGAEGGLIGSRDNDVLNDAASLCSFGVGGTNAKLSEYHAAIALTSMDTAWMRRKVAGKLAHAYSRWLGDAPVIMQPGTVDTDRSLFCVLLPWDRTASTVMERMTAAGIETKQWYAPFLDEVFGWRGPLPVTKQFRDRMIGLPFHQSLTLDDVSYVCANLKRILL
jgi:dTDP-4-amino-4,6-dideoxygalactose transaminase